MTVSEFFADFLEEKNFDIIFQYPGGMITQMIDVIDSTKKIKIHSLLHEQSIAFAVSSIGRIINKPSIAFATSGPGATNLITGIGDCYFDSVPALFITGQVNTHELKGKLKIRQLGFQETDIVSMVKPITKMAFQLTDPNQIVDILQTAYETSISGRPGPVLIDIPMNIQRANIDDPQKIKVNNKKHTLIVEKMDEIIKVIKESKSPLFWIGNGIHTSNSKKIFKEVNRILNIPVVTSLHGIDLLENTDPNKVGMIGAYGNRWSNKTVSEADCIIFLGTRLDIRQTGANLSLFNNIKTIRVDCESSELTNRLICNYTIKYDLNQFLNQLLIKIKNSTFNFNNWHERIRHIKDSNLLINEIKLNINEINPHQLFSEISTKIKGDTIYCSDVGNHQMWAAQSLSFKSKDRFLTSGGMGAMGFALPAAIAAAILDPSKNIVTIMGDGSFQMNIQELQSIFKYRLNIKIIVLNNNSLGMIRQFQDTNFKSRYIGTVWDYSCPDFCKIAKAYNISNKKILNNSELGSAIKWFLKGKNSKLLEVMIPQDINVYPKIAFGQTMDKMEPEFQATKIEST